MRRPDILPAGIADAKDDRVLRLISDWDAILEEDKLHDVVVVEDVELSEEVYGDDTEEVLYEEEIEEVLEGE